MTNYTKEFKENNKNVMRSFVQLMIDNDPSFQIIDMERVFEALVNTFHTDPEGLSYLIKKAI